MSTGTAKVCASCGNMWEAAFRFCPADGLPLTEDLHPIPAAGSVEVSDDGRDRAKRGSGRLLDIPPIQSSGEALPPRDTPTGPGGRVVPKLGPGAIAGPRTKRSRQVSPGEAMVTDGGAVRPELPRDPTLAARSGISPRPVDARASVESKPARAPAEAKPARAPAEAKPARAPAEAKPARAPAEAKPARAPAEAPPKPATPVESAKTGRAARAPTVSSATPDTGPMERVAAQAPSGKAAADEASQPRKRGFSETAWFMRVVDPNAVDPNTGKVKVQEGDYQRKADLPEEKRRLFSLGSKDRKRSPEEES